MDLIEAADVLLFLAPIVGSVLGVVGFFKARRALAEVAALRAQLAAAAPAAALPDAVPPVPPGPVRDAAPGSSVPPTPLGVRGEAPAGLVPMPPRGDPFPAGQPVPPPQASPEPAPTPEPASESAWDIEALLAQRWGVWLGAAALLLAAVFLVRTGVEQGWLVPTPAGRCALAALLGAGLIGTAEWLHRRPVPPHPAPAALAAGGVAALLAAAYATGVLYELVPPLVALGLMTAAGLAGLALSLRHGPLVAAVGLAGAFATPALVQGAPPVWPGLFAYLLLVLAAALAVMRATAWTWLGWTACVAGAAWVVLAALAGPGGDAWAPGVFVPAAAGLFLLLLPGAALDHPVGRRLAWVPFAALAGAGLLLTALTGDPAARAGVLLLSPVAIAAGWREPRLDRLPWLAALIFLSVLLTWAMPLWQPTGEAITAGDAVKAVLPGDWAPEAIRPLLLTAAGMAGLFAAAGLVLERRAARPLPWAGLVAAVPVLALATTYVQVAGFQPDTLWAGAALALAAGLVGAAALARRAAGEGGLQRAGVHAAGATAALALGCAVLLSGHRLTLAVALFLPPLALIEARVGFPALRRVALAVAALVLVRLVPDPTVLADDLGPWPALGLVLAYGVPAACFALAAALFRRRGDDAAVAVLEGGACALAAGLAVLEIRHWATRGDVADTTADGREFWEAGLYVCVLGGLGLALRRARSRPVLRVASRLLGGAALALGAGLLVLNPAVLGGDVGAGLLANALLVAYAAPAVLAALALRDGAGPRRGLGLYAGLALFAWVTLLVRHGFHPRAMALWDAGVEDAELWAYSGAWLAMGAALLAAGLRTGRRPLRLAALALVGLASAKVFLVDMAGLGGLWRVLSFLGLGLVLIGLGAFYRRFVLPASPPAG